jgi:hypothetical protein
MDLKIDKIKKYLYMTLKMKATPISQKKSMKF